MNKIEEKYGLKPRQAIIVLFVLALNVLWIVCNAIRHEGNILSIRTFMFIVSTFYVCYGYKKPHGNLMRYLLLLYAASVAWYLVKDGGNQPMYLSINYAAIVMLTTYMAGRLERYKQNVIISALVLIGNCITTYYLFDKISGTGTLTFINAVSYLGAITVWLAIATGYIIRYRLHKQAGLEDK